MATAQSTMTARTMLAGSVCTSWLSRSAPPVRLMNGATGADPQDRPAVFRPVATGAKGYDAPGQVPRLHDRPEEHEGGQGDAERHQHAHTLAMAQAVDGDDRGGDQADGPGQRQHPGQAHPDAGDVRRAADEEAHRGGGRHPGAHGARRAEVGEPAEAEADWRCKHSHYTGGGGQGRAGIPGASRNAPRPGPAQSHAM